MKKRNYIVALIFMLALQVQAQEYIRGSFPGHAKQPVSLLVYNGFQRQQIAETTVDSLGNFRFAFPDNYWGVAFLQFNKAEGIELMITSPRGFKVSGTSMFEIDRLNCENNEATQTLYSYYKQQLSREKALMGWKFLDKVYREDAYLKRYNKADGINREIRLLEKEGTDFIQVLPENSNLKWYLPLVSFVRDMPVSLQREPERIPRHIDFFMHTDFSDERFYNSGLLPVLMENYFFMLENMGKPLDSVYVEMNKATDYLVKNLQAKRPAWLPDAGVFLFNLFERRSLFPAAEHLSLLMLQQNSVQLSNDLVNRFEGYRTMKKGNRAPDIDFTKAVAIQKEKKDDSLNRYLKGYDSLSGIGTKYKLVIFGQGGCSDCEMQMQKIKQMYPEIQAHKMEVVYVSLDSEKSGFEPVANEYPWVSYFDYDSWKSKPVTDYHVFATPTIYLLGEKLEILYKVVSPEHLEAILKVLE
ncbi:MAG: thioredoxin family protein [Prolixibacteraceae bacterium]|nr:thioredoxin family protein [Prolixibacteraceae bacterium]